MAHGLGKTASTAAGRARKNQPHAGRFSRGATCHQALLSSVHISVIASVPTRKTAGIRIISNTSFQFVNFALQHSINPKNVNSFGMRFLHSTRTFRTVIP